MRPVAELDIEQADALVNCLRETAWVGAEELPAVHILPGGVSNRTVLVERANGDASVLKQALAKLQCVRGLVQQSAADLTRRGSGCDG